ncbi:hypothetical protein L6164_013286 [Bauhinia variegata]|uniref:Uncharacterized protein n=1 Tax=Bauhinia variegata TaxID=167791 RepID=A0ACB9PDS1_BAUVA|nr:hypothetical protein L6164_013286 [Bauhinia variegata]
MKSPMLVNATFFFLFVFLLATTLPSTKAINLIDADGNAMVSGLSYYMIPVANGNGGGITLGQTGGDTCPLTILQDADSSSTGLPVKLSDMGGIYHVEQDSPIRLEFVGNNVPSCVPSPALWGQVDQNLKIVNSVTDFRFQESAPDKTTYVISECLHYDVFQCSRVKSVDKKLVVSTSGKPLVVKFKRAYVNSERDSWSIV